MKKQLLKTWSLLILAVLIGAVSVQAQTLGAYEAAIPFDFTIGDKDYEAGDYVIRVKSPNYLANFLAISKAKEGELQAVAVMRNGDRSKKNEARLFFDRYGDHYFLTKIVAPGFGFSAPQSKGKVTVWYKGDRRPNPDTVSIVLNRRE